MPQNPIADLLMQREMAGPQQPLPTSALTPQQMTMSPRRQGMIASMDAAMGGLRGMFGLGDDSSASRFGEMLGAGAPFIPKGRGFYEMAGDLLRRGFTKGGTPEAVDAARYLLSRAPKPGLMKEPEKTVYQQLKMRVSMADRQQKLPLGQGPATQQPLPLGVTQDQVLNGLDLKWQQNRIFEKDYGLSHEARGALPQMRDDEAWFKK